MDLLTQARIQKINEMADAVLADAQRRAALDSSPSKSARLGMSVLQLEEYSMKKVIESLLKGKQGIEWECSKELFKRFDAPLGSLAIPMDVLEYRSPKQNYLVGASAPESLSFIDLIRNRSVALGFGVQLLPDLIDDVLVPRLISGSNVSWLTPGSTAVVVDPILGQVSATPKTAVAISEVSEQMMRQSSAETVIRRGLSSDLAVAIDAVIIAGTGGAQPLGIMNLPGLASITGTALSYAMMVNAQKQLVDGNGIINAQATGLAATASVAELLKTRSRFAGSDTPVWQGSIYEGRCEGVVARATKQVPASSLLLGDWSTLYLASWGPLTLEVDRGGTRFNQGTVGIRAMWNLDVIPTALSAFIKVVNIT